MVVVVVVVLDQAFRTYLGEEISGSLGIGKSRSTSSGDSSHLLPQDARREKAFRNTGC